MQDLTITAVSLLAISFTMSSCANKKPKTAKVDPQIERLFSEMDANRDGKLALDEVEGPLQREFMRIDTNSDSFLSKEEVAAAAPQGGNREGRPQGRQRPPRQ